MTVALRRTLAGEYVVEALTEKLREITTANGYGTNVSDVRRWTRDERFSIEGPTIIVHFAARQEMEAAVGPAINYYDTICNVQCLYFLAVHPQSEEPLDVLISAAAQDMVDAVERVDWPALEAYPERWETASFYSENPEESWDGVALMLHFRIRVDPEEMTRRLPFHK